MAKRIYTPGRKSDEDMESVGKATGRMRRANRTGKRGTYSAENREERHAGNGSVRSKRFVLHTDGRRRASYLEVQMPGKKRMDTGSFLRGYKVEEGMVFGRE